MRKSRWLLVLLAGLYTAFGAALPHITRTASDITAATFGLGFPTAMLLFSWCKLDAKERGVQIPTGASILVGGLAPLGIPYYFIATMRPSAAALAIAKAVGFYLVIAIALSGAQYLSAAVSV